MVSKIYHMSLSSPWPMEWMEGLVAPYQVKNKEELQQTQMIQEIVTHVRQLVSDMQIQLEHLMHLALAEDGPSAYAATIEQDIKQLEEMNDCADYEQMQTFFAGLKFGNLSAIRKFTGDPIKNDKNKVFWNGTGSVAGTGNPFGTNCRRTGGAFPFVCQSDGSWEEQKAYCGFLRY